MLSTFNDPFFGSTGLMNDPFLNTGWTNTGMMPRSRRFRNTGLVSGGETFVIPVDVLDAKEEYIVMAEVPGVPKDKINLHIENNLLTIRAEKPQLLKTDVATNFHYDLAEIPYGMDTRRIRLPMSVDQDSAETCFKDGVLCVKFKKRAGGEGMKKLEIKA